MDSTKLDQMLVDTMLGGSATTAANTTNTPTSLTVDELNAMLRSMPRVPFMKFDLFGHDIDDNLYEITESAKQYLHSLPGDSRDRRTVFVPRKRLELLFHTMRQAGIDVRLEPRIEHHNQPDERQDEKL